MVDITKEELSIGDSILVAFTTCGNTKMEYATITAVDTYEMKVRFDTHMNFSGKTRTLYPHNSKCIKQGRDARF